DYVRYAGARALFIHRPACGGDKVDMCFDCWIGRKEALKIRCTEDQQLTIAECHDVGGAWKPAQQRHFAEEGAAPQARRLVWEDHLNGSGRNEEYVGAAFAPSDDSFFR